MILEGQVDVFQKDEQWGTEKAVKIDTLVAGQAFGELVSEWCHIILERTQ